jgi:hypothetical protein
MVKQYLFFQCLMVSISGRVWRFFSNGHGVAETDCFGCGSSVLQPVLLICAVCLTVIVDICGSKLKWLKNIVSLY